MSRVLLIGGPGNISGGCAEELIAGGHPLAILKRTENADPRFADTVQFYRGDRSRPADLKAALDDFRPDAVVDFVCFDPERVEELAAVLPDPKPHYVLVSTIDTYGYPLSRIPMRENDPRAPASSPYAASKRACEEVVARLEREVGLPATIVRPTYSFGIKSGMLSFFAWGGMQAQVPRIRAGMPVLVPGDGNSILHTSCAHDVGRMPSMRRALEDPSNKARLAYFRIAAGLEEGAHEGTNWSDGDCYKWLEAMAHVYGATRDAELDVQMDEAIGWIAAAQEPDGYLNTQITLDPAKRRWQNVHDHELYNVGHCFTAAAVHCEATGKRNLLEVAVKLADYLCGVFLPTPRALANFGFNPSQIVGLVDLYRVTGDRRYLELAGVFVTNRGSAPDPGVNGDQNQDRVPLREETAAVGHAVTATYLWAGAADVYAETGEAALREALQRIWADVVSNKLYLTGAVGAHHFSASIRRDPVHEAFGLPHELPNATAYTETCANIGQGMWAWRMAALTGDARYGDVLEQVIYNSGLSGMSADGTRFCYTNPLRWHGAEHRRLSHDTPERWFTHSCYCCPPQVARTIARLHRWAYGLAHDAVWVHLYGGSRLQTEVAGGALVLTQETDYPWDGTVVITLQEAPAEPFTLHLRVPGWAQGAELEVAGAPVAAAPGTYVAVRRHWQAGDRVTLTLPLHAELVTANPRLEQDRNQAAVVRGPVVYCLEAVDLAAGSERDQTGARALPAERRHHPHGTPLDEIHLPRDFAPVAHYEPDLLGGIAVLEGTAIRAKARPWQHELYRRGEAADRVPVPIRMIPYFAWHNRGNHAMAVWLPLA